MWVKLVLALARYIVDYISQLNGAMYKELIEAQAVNLKYVQDLEKLRQFNLSIDQKINTLTLTYSEAEKKLVQLDKELELSQEEFNEKFINLKKRVSELSPDDILKFDFGSTGSKNSRESI